jgi:hypothetical protein
VKQTLILRLDQIGHSIRTREGMIALLGLGSVGVELDRLDEQSDLDFFVITANGFKKRYLEDLSWLKSVMPVPYFFRNTEDGYKFMFEDGIYGEFAIFDESEIPNVTQSEGRIVWIKEGIQPKNLTESKGKQPVIYEHHVAYRMEEALTNLYVGCSRAIRGERLSGYRFIESYALGNLLSVIHHFETKVDGYHDAFNIERRFEEHFPTFQSLPLMCQGYWNIAKSAQTILDYIVSHYEINPFFQGQIQIKINQLSAIETCYNEK